MFLPPPPVLAHLPLVELFTSEGCSSCPPAEALLTRYVREGRITLLAQHVDYWDRLGWHDPFSSRMATDRQNGYATRFALDQIYTPQAIVNGTSQFVGSDEAALGTALRASSRMAPIQIRIDSKMEPWRVVTPKIEAADVVLATVLPLQTTHVERGENGGRTLVHLGVVQTMRRLGAAGEIYAVSAPPVGTTLVAFVQRRGYREIVGSASATR